jgi:hypothetical protein
MEFVAEWWRPLYAVVGAGARVVEYVQRLPAQLSVAWQEREDWMRYIGDTYDDLADRGEAALGGAQAAVQGQAREAGRKARRVPAVAAAEGEVTGWFAEEGGLSVDKYDSLTVDEITERLPGLSQRQLHQIEGYETRNKARIGVLSRIEELRGAEPWAGYDEMTVDEILPRLRTASRSKRAEVAEHEQRHKRRRTIVSAARG